MEERLLNWCKRLIGCPSVTGVGTRAIVELCMRELLSPAGIESRLIESRNEGPAQVNLIARVAGAAPEATAIVLNTHLDTVPPGDAQSWSACGSDPFAATITGERIYGLGAADTKLDFAAKVFALIGARPRRDVTLIATFGEEHGLVGARELAEAGELPRGALAFIGEPSRLEVITAHKGLMVFTLRIGFERRGGGKRRSARLRFEGRPAHSSTPALGQNAIKLALTALSTAPAIELLSIRGGDVVNKVPARCEVLVSGQIPAALEPRVIGEEEISGAPIPRPVIEVITRFVGELQSFADRIGSVEQDYAAPTLTCNPGVIGSMDDEVELEFELRPPPGLGLEVVRAGVEGLVADVRQAGGRLSVELRERRANHGFRAQLDSETVELAMAALARAGLPLATNVKAGCTEAGVYAAAGLKPVVFGPGPSTGVIHAPNEYNLISDVEGAASFYRELLTD